jgi:FkbM family methyltransferase
MLINKIKRKIAVFLIDKVSNNKFLLEELLSKNREKLVSESIAYPSIINNGYLHMEQVFDLADYFNLKGRKGIVIDAGAADGKISIMLEQHFTSSDIYSFEPIKSTFDELAENVKGRTRIHIFNKALGSKQQSLVINKSHRITSSSLFPIEEKIKDSYFAENILKVGEETIVVSKLDDEIPANVPVNLIKIDVQGFELEVLKGGAGTLSRTSLIIFEAQNHDMYIGAPKYYELDAFLRNNNFVLYNIVPSLRKNMKLYEWDAIYVSKELDLKVNN